MIEQSAVTCSCSSVASTGPGNQDIVNRGRPKGNDRRGTINLHVKRSAQAKDRRKPIANASAASQQEKVGTKHALDAGQEIHLKAGMKVIIEAGTQISLKVGGNFVDISPAGVTIVGTMVLINSGGLPRSRQRKQPGRSCRRGRGETYQARDS